MPVPHGRWRPLHDPLFIILAVVLLVALVFAGVYLLRSEDGYTPEPAGISQDELVTEYQVLAPGDDTVTPSALHDLAATICKRIDTGTSVNQLATDLTDTYHSKARAERVVRLLVSYGCPRHNNAT